MQRLKLRLQPGAAAKEEGVERLGGRGEQGEEGDKVWLCMGLHRWNHLIHTINVTGLMSGKESLGTQQAGGVWAGGGVGLIGIILKCGFVVRMA